MGDSDVVLITGATGFLATHCIKLLQEKGWRVRGTVRNVNDEKKTSALYGIVPNAKYKLELIEADLTKPDSWQSAVQGCKYVLHVASPFPGAGGKVKDVENDLMRPAIDGTLNVLRACAKSGTVKRVVVTSSVAAVFSDTKHKGEERKYSEEDWTDVDDPHCDKYCVSKTRAEKEAWDFVKQLPANEKFELTTVCPSFIYGPLLTNLHSEATSLEPLILLMNRDIRLLAGVPHYMFPICDARDVADAHLKAMLSPKAPGQRFIVHSESVWFVDMCHILAKHFGKYGYKFPFLEIPTIASWFACFLDSNVKHYMYPRLGLKTDYDNSKLKNVLEITPRKGEDIIVDMARSMVTMGYARRLRNFPVDGEESKE